MSAQTKRLIKKLINYSGIFFFILAAGMLWWQLRNYSLADIFHAITDIPLRHLAAACLACFAGYLVLSLYDYLALNYVGGRVAWWKWMLAGMLGFAISNNAGNAAISGGAIRYRLYTRWRIRGGDIFKMLTLSGLTYFLGVAAIVVVGYFLIPHNNITQSAGLSMGLGWLFGICLAMILTYFLVTIIFQKKNIKIGNILFQVPTPKTATLQILLGIADSILAGLVLYFCLTPFVTIPFGTFIGLFVIAQATGIFSQVPGGIGVFETIFLAALPDTADKAAVFGALLAYRIIYYVLPLIGVGGLFFIYERWLRAKMKQWAAQAKQEITQIQQKIKNTAKKVRKSNKK